MSTPRASSMRSKLGLVVAVTVLAGFAVGCGDGSPRERLQGQVLLTILHTSDIHSRLLPYNLQIGHFDAQLGLGENRTIQNVGGAARLSYVLQRERARTSRSLYLDSGDVFQGAPIFNYYDGEAEFRVLKAMGLDATVIGNHEFDKGGLNLAEQAQKWANFPMLSANYWFEDSAPSGASQINKIAQPYQIFDVDGLLVATIGMGTLTSITSIYDMP
ncbi:MAG: metallophosphoesterase, partial [Deltaproteobacteria bacterium]|nr:metallophosphoesterase [Deltaproteobacteria bacterium]MBW2537475.1 metallophosphoesterase [Deltaproteobacteria bacterium]